MSFSTKKKVPLPFKSFLKKLVCVIRILIPIKIVKIRTPSITKWLVLILYFLLRNLLIITENNNIMNTEAKSIIISLIFTKCDSEPASLVIARSSGKKGVWRDAIFWVFINIIIVINE